MIILTDKVCKYNKVFSIFNKKSAIGAVFVLFFSLLGLAQTRTQREYIERWAPLAIEHQRLHGIPASITLAQGLLESAAGTSYLATEGNNHFGIKCHRAWRLDSIFSGSSCYRRYATPEESFNDHSLFLKGSRYGALFELSVDDYAGWARGLKSCGYATDPTYDTKLISIIEQCDLNRFVGKDGDKLLAERDKQAEKDKKIKKDKKKPALPAVMHPVSRRWDLHCVKVVAGDTYQGIAEEFNMKLDKLLSLNDLDKKNAGEPQPGTLVYLEKKNKQAQEGHDLYHARKGDTLWSIAQAFGIRVKDLRKLNHFDSHHEPAEGDPIALR